MKVGKLMNIVLSSILIFGLLFSVGCSTKETTTDIESTKDAAIPEKPIVAVTITPEKSFVEAVCGDKVDVVVMVPPGNSPENYEPTPKEMEQFSKAKIYFTIGVPTESSYILPKAKEISEMKVIKLQDEVAKTYNELEIAPGQRDPHIWLSPKRAKEMVKIINREVGQLDTENAKEYEKNAQAYEAELDHLDDKIKTILADVKNRKFIVFHPAFAYLADDYDLKMFALEEEGKETTPQRLREMLDFAKAENIKAVFYQAEISNKQAQSFAEEIGGKTVQLEPLALNYIENFKKMAELMAEVMK